MTETRQGRPLAGARVAQLGRLLECRIESVGVKLPTRMLTTRNLMS